MEANSSRADFSASRLEGVRMKGEMECRVGVEERREFEVCWMRWTCRTSGSAVGRREDGFRMPVSWRVW